MFNLKIDQSFLGDVFFVELNFEIALFYMELEFLENMFLLCFFLLKPVGPMLPRDSALTLEVSITKTKLCFGALVSHGWHVYHSAYVFEMIVKPPKI